MDEQTGTLRDLHLLEEIERDPDTTQANLATRLGVAVGTVNWHLKRLIAKGYVKVKRAERRKLRYIITPEGLSLRARLTVKFIEQSMSLYRETREQAAGVLERLREEGYQRVVINGVGDIADVCRLTCLEQGLEVVEEPSNGDVPVVIVAGRELELQLPVSGPGELKPSSMEERG
ncbi:MAG: winged helix-turn-helix transcriptional regulator [Anaerolineales bacterium]